ncbi:hypothetical protein J2X36_002533 [Methylobacterium sp. BE186]|nr:hypothetical protein [Methylobacterium sp. BE186]
MDAVDLLVEAVTGGRKHFHLTAPTTPSGNLAPAKAEEYARPRPRSGLTWHSREQ